MASKEDTKPAESYRTCLNCQYPMPEIGQYCGHCGQRFTDGKITVAELFRQFFSDILNVDAKIWQTLLALFVPGKLTVAFFRGQQQRYVRPLRLFFVFSLIAIAAISFFEAEFTETFFVSIEDDFRDDIRYQDFLVRLDTTANQIQAEGAFEDYRVLDSLRYRLRNGVSDSLDIGVRIDWNTEEILVDNFKVAKLDIAHLTMDSIFELYQVEKFEEKLFLQQNIRLRENESDLGNYVINKTVWMMLLLMPVLALLMKLLYIRRAYYYVEHLIFSFHTHAFIFLLLSILLVLEHYMNSPLATQRIFTWGAIIGEVYFFLALRRFYQQGYGKTFLKFLLLNLLYAFLFLIALIFTIIISALMY